jgi:hypothetical protein
MHFKNGREAKPGDVVINLQSGEIGVVYDTVAGIKQCSARLARMMPNDSYVILGTCLHLDDVAAAAIPDSTAAPAAAVAPTISNEALEFEAGRNIALVGRPLPDAASDSAKLGYSSVTPSPAADFSSPGEAPASEAS